jgi:hypothetical protein
VPRCAQLLSNRARSRQTRRQSPLTPRLSLCMESGTPARDTASAMSPGKNPSEALLEEIAREAELSARAPRRCTTRCGLLRGRREYLGPNPAEVYRPVLCQNAALR